MEPSIERLLSQLKATCMTPKSLRKWPRDLLHFLLTWVRKMLPLLLKLVLLSRWAFRKHATLSLFCFPPCVSTEHCADAEYKCLDTFYCLKHLTGLYYDCDPSKSHTLWILQQPFSATYPSSLNLSSRHTHCLFRCDCLHSYKRACFSSSSLPTSHHTCWRETWEFYWIKIFLLWTFVNLV